MLVVVFNFWRGLDEGDDWCNWCVWAPLGCNNSKFSQIMCIICFIFHITQVKFLKLFLTLHTPVSSKKGKVFLVSHSDKVISELFGYQSRLLWYRWLCVRAHDVGWKGKRIWLLSRSTQVQNVVEELKHRLERNCYPMTLIGPTTSIVWFRRFQMRFKANAKRHSWCQILVPKIWHASIFWSKRLNWVWNQPNQTFRMT